MAGTMMFNVPMAEMREHLAARAAYHAERAKHYAAEAVKQTLTAEEQLAHADTVSDRFGIKNTSEYSNVRSAADRARTQALMHEQIVHRFTFMGAHLPPWEFAALRTDELTALEFIK